MFAQQQNLTTPQPKTPSGLHIVSERPYTAPKQTSPSYQAECALDRELETVAVLSSN